MVKISSLPHPVCWMVQYTSSPLHRQQQCIFAHHILHLFIFFIHLLYYYISSFVIHLFSNIVYVLRALWGTGNSKRQLPLVPSLVAAVTISL